MGKLSLVFPRRRRSVTQPLRAALHLHLRSRRRPRRPLPTASDTNVVRNFWRSKLPPPPPRPTPSALLPRLVLTPPEWSVHVRNTRKKGTRKNKNKKIRGRARKKPPSKWLPGRKHLILALKQGSNPSLFHQPDFTSAPFTLINMAPWLPVYQAARRSTWTAGRRISRPNPTSVFRPRNESTSVRGRPHPF